MTSDSLPYPADLRVPLSSDELAVLQEAYDKENAGGYPGLQTRFNLAWCAFVMLCPSAHSTVLIHPYKHTHTQGSDEKHTEGRHSQGRPDVWRAVPTESRPTARVPLLFGIGSLQIGQL